MKSIVVYLMAALLSGILTIPLSSAAETPAPPLRSIGRFAQNGKIDRLDVQEGIVVVDDRLYKLSPSVRIYLSTGSAGSSDMLKKGMKIGFNVSGSQGTAAHIMTEVVMLSPE